MEKSYRIPPVIPGKDFHFNSFFRSSKMERIYGSPHWHDEIEILMFITGDASQQVDGNIFNVTSGDIVFINSNSVHSTHTKLNHCNEILVIHFPLYIINESTKNLEILKKGINIPNTIRSSNLLWNVLSKLLLEIQREYDCKNTGFEFIIIGHLCVIVGLLIRTYGVKSVKAKNPAHFAKERDLLKNAFDYIELNFSQKISFQDMLNISNLSPSYFCRNFKKATGMNFTDYVSLHRVNYAHHLLISTNKSITEIMFDSGFENHVSFIRAFKKYKEITPSAFRKNYITG